MELRHLRYFAAVAETRHFGRAAERLHLAQPALSQSVRQLEAELGAPLFARTTRQVQLTPAGEFLQREAARVLAAVEDSARGVRRIAEGRQGLVRIAFTGTAAYTQLPRIARLVKRELPGVALEIHADLLTPAQLDGLLDGGRLDLGVLRPPVGRDGSPLRTIAVRAPGAGAARRPPAGRRAGDLRWPTCVARPFVIYADGPLGRERGRARSCREAGFAPRREHEAPGTAVLLALVAAGLGVALVPESVRRPAPGRAWCSATSPDAATTDLALAWRADDDSPLVARVLACSRRTGSSSTAHRPRPSRPHGGTRDEDHPGRGDPLRHPATASRCGSPAARCAPPSTCWSGCTPTTASSASPTPRRGRSPTARPRPASIAVIEDHLRARSSSALDLLEREPIHARLGRTVGNPAAKSARRHGDLGRRSARPSAQPVSEPARRLHRPDARLPHARLRRAGRAWSPRPSGCATTYGITTFKVKVGRRPYRLDTAVVPRPARGPRRRRRAVRRRQPRLVRLRVGPRAATRWPTSA